MTTVTLKEAQSGLADIIHRLTPGDEVVITENDQPVARLVPTPPIPKKAHRQLESTQEGCRQGFDAARLQVLCDLRYWPCGSDLYEVQKGPRGTPEAFKKVVPDALSAKSWFRFHGQYANAESVAP